MGKLESKYLALSGRERFLMILLAFGGLLYIGYAYLLEPTYKDLKANQARIVTLNNTVKTNQIEIERLTIELSRDPDEAVDAELQKLAQQQAELTERLRIIIGSLVNPDAMADLLDNVLNQTTNLKLVSLESLPLEPLKTASQETFGYYLHPVRIVLTGKYFDIQDYLLKLEAMEVKYYWRSFNYDVQEYPTAQLELTVYTIGERQEFIGG